MSIIKSLLGDSTGTSPILTAVMIGLSSSAILVVVRIGVAAAGQ
jgi:hypothetical protein